MWLLHYNKNTEKVKLHFSLCDFSEIAKPKINEMTQFDPTVLLLCTCFFIITNNNAKWLS